MENVQRTAVYEIHYEGELMYVGVSINPRMRASGHGTTITAPRGSVLTVVGWYDTRREAGIEERRRIDAGKPPMNIQSVKSSRFIHPKDRASTNEAAECVEFFDALDAWINDRKR